MRRTCTLGRSSLRDWSGGVAAAFHRHPQRLGRRDLPRVYEEILTEERFATENKEIVREAESNK